MNFREALDGLICIAMFNAIAERVAVNEVIRNTLAGRRMDSTSQLTIEKAGVVCYDKKD